MDDILQKMLARIDKKLESLQRARATLLEEFDEKPPRVIAIPPTDPMEELRASLRASGSGEVEPKPKRKESLIDFLVFSGPRTRKDICAQTGIPEGTVAFVMRDREVFRQNSDGRWDVTDKVRFEHLTSASEEQEEDRI
jgi:hypothetical protein